MTSSHAFAMRGYSARDSRDHETWLQLVPVAVNAGLVRPGAKAVAQTTDATAPTNIVVQTLIGFSLRFVKGRNTSLTHLKVPDTTGVASVSWARTMKRCGALPTK